MDQSIALIIVAVIAVLTGALIGWLLAGRQSGGEAVAHERALAALQAERDVQTERARAAADERAHWEGRYKLAIGDLEEEVRRREAADLHLASITSERTERERALGEQIAALKDAQAALTAQFREVGQVMLDTAQKQFLERAEARFRESEATAGQHLKALLNPVHQRLEEYEKSVRSVEKDRQEAYGNLSSLIETMRLGQEDVKRVTASLNNSLRNAPKARGRWGEQQLRNVLESCGLAEHVDFHTEVSLDTEDGRQRPDAIVNVPGGRQLVIDAKVSLNAYQDAFAADDDAAKRVSLSAHCAAMKAHVTTLGTKAYQDKFAAAADYVIMFVPGEHFLAAALEHDPALWDYAFERRVLLATPTNLVAIARTVAGVWRQEKMADQAREIGLLGKELYARLSKMGEHVGKLGRNLNLAANAYNDMVGNLESQVLTSARRFEALNVDRAGKEIPALPVVEQTIRPLTKLAMTAEPAER